MKKTIGIIGGGQLGRMLTIPAQKLGFHVTILDLTPNCPAAQIADAHIQAAFTDDQAIRSLAEQVDFVTYEIEHIHEKVLEDLEAEGKPVNPSPQSLAIIKDKLRQKEFFRHHGIATGDFFEIPSDNDQSDMLLNQITPPFLLKSRFGAYDGRGNHLVQSKNDLSDAVQKLGNHGLYAEAFVPFTQEVAIIGVRGMQGQIAMYPVVETVHKNNICHIVRAPAQISETVKKKAQSLARRVLEKMNGTGTFGIEMFVTKENEVLLNEVAPRVHNSGHFTIEACHTSQFENHIRAVTDMPLGSVELKVPAAVMINILGQRQGKADPQEVHKAEQIPGVAVHIYGKAETKPERKMGHITAIADSVSEAESAAQQARSIISI
jgi:phosphoribosylaminoimidazole carboxylase PurK protein